jgi:hypothetical protein
MAAYLYSAPNGVPGDITRTDESNVEPAMLIAISSVYAQAFGIPMKYASGGISQIASGDAATVFAGVLVREVPSISGNTLQGFDDTVPNPDAPQGLCVRGYISVKCVVGTPARGGVVYMQSVANGGVAVGAFRADGTDSGNAVALTAAQASWASDGKDADNNAEMRIAR